MSRTDKVDRPRRGVSDGRWLPLTEAAPLMGLSIDALRKRVARGRVQAQRDNAGHWRVLVDGVSETMSTLSVLDIQDGLAAELATVRGDLDKSRTEAAEARAENEALKAAAAERDQRLARLEADVADLRAERDRLLAIIERSRWPGIWLAVKRFLYGADT